MDYTLAQLNEDALAIGKGVILYALEWDGVADLTLTHLGDTEGDITFNSGEKLSGLKVRERYGDAYVRAYVAGADPVLTAPLFLADPTLRSLISPSGDGVIGTDARRPVVRYTLVVFPQFLFYNDETGKNDAKIRYTTAAGWQKSAEATGDPDVFAALSADETRMLGLSLWIWSGYFERPAITYRATIPGEDDVLDIETVTFHGMRPTDEDLPMVTVGSPLTHGIVIDVA